MRQTGLAHCRNQPLVAAANELTRRLPSDLVRGTRGNGIGVAYSDKVVGGAGGSGPCVGLQESYLEQSHPCGAPSVLSATVAATR